MRRDPPDGASQKPYLDWDSPDVPPPDGARGDGVGDGVGVGDGDRHAAPRRPPPRSRSYYLPRRRPVVPPEMPSTSQALSDQGAPRAPRAGRFVPDPADDLAHLSAPSATTNATPASAHAALTSHVVVVDARSAWLEVLADSWPLWFAPRDDDSESLGWYLLRRALSLMFVLILVVSLCAAFVTFAQRIGHGFGASTSPPQTLHDISVVAVSYDAGHAHHLYVSSRLSTSAWWSGAPGTPRSYTCQSVYGLTFDVYWYHDDLRLSHLKDGRF